MQEEFTQAKATPEKSEALVQTPEPESPAVMPPAATSDRRAEVDAYIAGVHQETGKKIMRKDIWTVAGYKDRTEFERFQRGDDRTTKSAAVTFSRVLRMNPKDFVQSLDKQLAAKK